MAGSPQPPVAYRADRERMLLRRYHDDGDSRARDQLAEEMLPLARALAGRYAGRGEPLDDLVQVACVGIMKAIEGFDLDREVDRKSTRLNSSHANISYAVFCLKKKKY